MTWPDNLTQEQRDAIEEFKRRTIKDATPKLLEDETIFYRFMKARDFDLEKAETMFRKHIAWRKEYQIDTLLTDYEPPEVLEKYNPNSLMCFDKEGSIVRYLDVGGCDPKGFINSSKKIDFIKFNMLLIEQDLELLKKRSAILGKKLTTISYVYNYDKLTFANATYRPALELLILGLNTYQDNYPERIKTLYIINASIYFTLLFSVIKHVIAAPVLAKMKVFGSEGWKEALLQDIDADQLPAFLGGNRTDPDGDPLCKTFIRHGEPIPHHYYLSESKRRLSLAPGVKKLKLAPFSKQDIKFEVDDPGCFLEWKFETKSKDIGFGVYYKGRHNTEAKAVEVIPKQRIETCFETETGIYKCEKTGTYSIVFDNSYSWIYSKEIYYIAKIIQPSEIECQ